MIFLFRTSFFLWLLAAPPGLLKCGASVQREAVTEGRVEPFLAAGPAVLVKCHYRQRR